MQGEAKSRGERESKHSDGAGESGRHMKEYYCFFCILMTKPEMRQTQEGGLESRGEQVSGGRAIHMFIQAERREG